MGTTHIEISQIHRSRSNSLGSQEDELHENGVHVSVAEASPAVSLIHPHSHSGSSSHHGDYVHLTYPSEETGGGGDLHPSDSASRIDLRERTAVRNSRTSSIRRQDSRHSKSPHDPIPPRHRATPVESPSESADSAEDFLREQRGMPRPQSYYGQNHYTYSSSSGSYGHPHHPPSNQVILQQQPPLPQPFPAYPPITSPPPPMAYPPSHASYPVQYPHPPPSQISSPYTNSPYGQPMPYGAPAPSGYFPAHYQPQQYHPQQFMPQYAPPYQQPMMTMSPYVDAYRVQSPPQAQAVSPPPSSASESEKAKAEQEEMIKRLEALMKAQSDERKQADTTREEALREAAEKIKAEATARAQREAEDRRIREDARLEAMRAYEEKARAVAEQVAREQQIRKEAAEAALKAAEKEAAAKAERAALEKKIAEDAAAAAKTAAEKEHAEATAKAKEDAKKAADEAETKLKEAEEAAKKAQAEAEAAEKKAKDAAPPERRAPVRFKDAIGRNYNFPWERCHRWRDMESLIIQAFAHIDNLAEHVMNGHYDLLGPDKEIIMPNYWESTVEPDMHITMMLWPLPEKDDDAIPPPGDTPFIDIDDLLNPKPGKDKGGKGKKKSGKPSAIAGWLAGGPRKSTKKSK